MKPVVLLVGKLRDVIGATAEELDHMPVEWLGAHNRDEVIEQLDAEPKIACAIIGGSLDDHLRGELVALIASRLWPRGLHWLRAPRGRRDADPGLRERIGRGFVRGTGTTVAKQPPNGNMSEACFGALRS